MCQTNLLATGPTTWKRLFVTGGWGRQWTECGDTLSESPAEDFLLIKLSKSNNNEVADTHHNLSLDGYTK